MRSLQKVPFPAKTCDVILLNTLERLNSGFRRNEEFQGFATFCSNIIIGGCRMTGRPGNPCPECHHNLITINHFGNYSADPEKDLDTGFRRYD
ncbi:MAG: hypothetical protein EA399_09070 [Desulfovibrionales bacterium]|nr:MAG: hypothetical protein EA399_09070 [Desulfovibrionales bacterium]